MQKFLLFYYILLVIIYLWILFVIIIFSFWGKFGQCSNLGATEYFDEPEEFFKVVTDPTNELTGIRFCGEKLAYVNYKKDDEFVDAQSNVNVVIASFVTAQARLRLYEDIEKLQERVLYFDTDSLLFVTRPQDVYTPELGSFLGDWTDELAGYGPDSYITEFVSGGPKNYAFKVLCPATGKTETVTKVRGFTLNYTCSWHLNFCTL